MSMSANTITIKQLFGCSYNECAHPECDQKLVELDALTSKAVVYAEIAHIHGQKPRAERFSQAVYENKAELHGFNNLLLLCAKHHKQIDETDAGKIYTADMIREWKANHELRHAIETDREWVFGGQTINFTHEGERVSLSYWIANDGELRFHTDEELSQTASARDLSILFSQLGSLFSILEQTDGEPADPSRQTMNDAYLRQLKKASEDMKVSWCGSVPEGGFQSALHRLYHNLNNCPDITLGELAEVGSKKREMQTTMIIGPVTPQRLGEALDAAKEREITKKS
jgi:hypothetical protein